MNGWSTRMAGTITPLWLLYWLLSCQVADAAIDVLDRVDITQGTDQSTIHIHLNIPVSYRSHAPKHSGDFLRISVEPLPSPAAAGDALLGAEYIQWNASRQVPLLDVIYVGEGIGNTAISLRFQSDVQFEVVKTADFRLLNVVVKHPQAGTPAGAVAVSRDMPGPRPDAVRASGSQVTSEGAGVVPASSYVINLASSIQPFQPERLPQLEEFTTCRLYTTRFNKDGKIWNRLRLGFFKSVAAATAVMNRLKRHYPQAWVAKASDAEKKRSVDTVLVDSPRVQSAAVSPPVHGRQIPEKAETQPASRILPSLQQASGPALPAERLEVLMNTAREMMTAKDYTGAIRNYTRVTESAENRYSQDALEFLGLAREYKGQRAQAKRVYEQYLESYPEGEGAERVRQRLAALLTARKQPRGKLRAARGNTREQKPVWDVFGGFSQYYRRDQNTAGVNDDDDEVTTVTQSSVDSNVDITARRRSGDYDVRTRFTGGYLHDFLDEGVNSDTTVSSLYLDARDRKRELSMRLGRQSRSTGGVLGRFDGLLLGFPLGKKLAASAVGGYPVQSSTDNLDADRYFYGLTLASSGFAEGWDANVFTIEQRAEGSVDRRAVGGELRYFDASHSFFSLVDYDIYYNELNIAQFLGNWIFPDMTTLNLTLDYRNSPILTTYNALTGQGVDSLDALQDIYTDSEIQDLARDRTATSKLATLGVSHPLNENLQVSGDVTATRLSGTSASGGVLGLDGSGTDWFYNLQLIGSNLIKTGDITILGVRYSDTETSGITSLFLNTRFPFNNDLRINPRFRVDYRNNRNDNTDQIIYRPSMLLAYQVRRRLRLEAEVGGEYSDREVVDGSQKDASYFFNIGYRSDF